MSSYAILELMGMESESQTLNQLCSSVFYPSLMKAAMMSAIKSQDLWSGSVSFDAGGERAVARSPFQPGLAGGGRGLDEGGTYRRGRAGAVGHGKGHGHRSVGGVAG